MENSNELIANSILKKRALVGAIILSAAVTAGTFGLWPVSIVLAFLSGGIAGQIGTLHERKLIDWKK